MTGPCFTVFTPTFNRAATLPDVYSSLRVQTFGDFEWLIVDDGSTDATAQLISGWQQESRLKIRYFRQSNAGKHAAFNRGVSEAYGDLFLPLDSDDTLPDSALETFRNRWLEIPEELRSEFSGVTCQCVDERGGIVGTPLLTAFVDGYPSEVVSSLGLRGERFGFHRTSILKQFPFPVLEGERFVPEGLIWNRIGKQYKIRFIADTLRVYRDSSDGLSASMTQIRRRSPRGTTLYYLEAMDNSRSVGVRFRHAINACRFALNLPARRLIDPFWQRHFLILSVALPLGRMIGFVDGRLNS